MFGVYWWRPWQAAPGDTVQQVTVAALTAEDAKALLVEAGYENTPSPLLALRPIGLLTGMPVTTRDDVRRALEISTARSAPMLKYRNGYPLSAITPMMVLAMMEPADIATLDKAIRTFHSGPEQRQLAPIKMKRPAVQAMLSIERLASPCLSYKLTLQLDTFAIPTNNVACFNNPTR